MIFICHVPNNMVSSVTEGVHRSFQHVGSAAGENHRGAVRMKHLGARQSETASAAGDQRNLSVEDL